jgi:hypothetical protein
MIEKKRAQILLPAIAMFLTLYGRKSGSSKSLLSTELLFGACFITLYQLVKISTKGAFSATLCAQDAMRQLKTKHMFLANVDGLSNSGLPHPLL